MAGRPALYDGSAARLRLTVQAVTQEAHRIKAFELADPCGEDLPAFTAGAHVDIEVPGGFLRQYSLCNDPSDRARYEIAVLDVVDGRGGSRGMHTEVRVGDTLTVSHPRNSFPLDEGARRCLLLAGGVGITPVMSMVQRLASIAADFSVVYCARSPEHAAFRRRLEQVASRRVRFHYDGGVPERGIDLAHLLATAEPDTHLYCCGPAGMMAAVAAGTSRWRPECVHFEHFSAPALPVGTAATASDGFAIELARSGTVLTVPADKTIVEVLREAGVHVETSCEAGVCATCRTRYLHGAPDHQDFILDDDERAEYLTICCSRSLSERLVLDL